MKTAKSAISAILLAGATIGVVLGIIYGINKLGGLIWQDEAPV